MTARPIGHRIVRLDEVESTNSYLLQAPELLREHGVVVIAHSQTAGRGRMKRQFVTFPGKNLTFSVVIHSKLHLDQLGAYALVSGVAVARVLEPLLAEPVRLKWPNDVLIGSRKICGILVEVAHVPELDQPVLVVGIGLNCLGSPTDYPDALRPLVTTLEHEIREPVELDPLLSEILSSMEEIVSPLQNQGMSTVLNEWLYRSDAVGKQVHYETPKGWKTGRIEGLTSEGYLLIQQPSGEWTTHISGDVVYSELEAKS